MGSKWMCDIVGFQPTSEKKIEKLADDITPETIEKFIEERGNLSTNVKEHIKKLGYEWSDSGGSYEQWHIGVPFDDFFEAVNYLLKMTTHFQKAISNGLLYMKLMTWTREKWKKEEK